MRVFLALVLSFSVGLAGCSQGTRAPAGEKLPAAQTLLNDSAEAMAKVTSVGFALKIDGQVQGLGIKSAEGSIRSDGNAKATALVSVGSRAVEYQYFLVDGKSYLKGPTGGFQDLPASLASSLFNPGALLSGDKSLSKGLSRSTGARTQAREDVNGVDSYRIKATVDPNTVEGLSQLAPGSKQQATLWISRADKYLVKASMTPAGPAQKDQTTLTVTFSDFNQNVEINAPA